MLDSNYNKCIFHHKYRIFTC